MCRPAIPRVETIAQVRVDPYTVKTTTKRGGKVTATSARQVAFNFGDDWQHVLVHEGCEPADDGQKYPRCIAGEGRCPPEDCGGVRGYAEFLQALADPHREEQESTRRWVGGSFDPLVFDPASVKLTIRRSAGRRHSSGRE